MSCRYRSYLCKRGFVWLMYKAVSTGDQMWSTLPVNFTIYWGTQEPIVKNSKNVVQLFHLAAFLWERFWRGIKHYAKWRINLDCCFLSRWPLQRNIHKRFHCNYLLFRQQSEIVNFLLSHTSHSEVQAWWSSFIPRPSPPPIFEIQWTLQAVKELIKNGRGSECLGVRLM